MKKLIRIEPDNYIGIQYTGDNLEEVRKFLDDYVNFGMEANLEKNGNITLIDDVDDSYSNVNPNDWITICAYDDYVQVWSVEEFNKTFREVPNERAN